MASISKFRPHETIFEVGNRGNSKGTEAAQIMRTRRAKADAFIQAKKEKQKQTTTNEYEVKTGITDEAAIKV